ncbi:Rhodanese-like domain-containing protein 15, chloroplastic [Ancistrocladus abbreviatus]
MAMLTASSSVTRSIPIVIRPYNLTRHPMGTPSISQMIRQSKSQLKIRCRLPPRCRTFGLRTSAGRNSETTGVPTSVPVRIAHELLQAGHRYLDVRTSEEFSAGHVPDAINIPYMFKLSSGMTKNPKFLEDVSSQFGKDDEILVACQVGKRSLMAAADLLSAGYTGVTDIAGGYAAWTQNGLPTES